MNEWEGFGGRLNPGALRRFSNPQKKNITYDKWLEWIEEDRQSTQDLSHVTNTYDIIFLYNCTERWMQISDYSPLVFYIRRRWMSGGHPLSADRSGAEKMPYEHNGSLDFVVVILTALDAMNGLKCRKTKENGKP